MENVANSKKWNNGKNMEQETFSTTQTENASEREWMVHKYKLVNFVFFFN